MKQEFGEITANVALSAGTHLLRIHAPEIARHAVPGQFVHVRCAAAADPLLRRPLSIARVAAADLTPLPPSPTGRRGGMETGRTGTSAPTLAGMGEGPRVRTAPPDELALLIEVVGRGSALLAAAEVGDRLDMLGPLGRGFALHPKARQILLVAGGAGIAPLLALAEQALDRQIAVTLLFGARTAAKVFPAALLPPEVEYSVLTDDGSLGRPGVVTAAVPDLVAWADQIFACGPTPMLRAIAETLRQRALPVPDSAPPFVQVSLEQRMGCAMGACYGCVVDTVAGRQRVCRDGPVFDLFEVNWW